ncbi:MAG: class I SAM-dependent methyltransferase [Cyanobacteriota bacterium]|jgi:SAM-dependent methyltransferase
MNQPKETFREEPEHYALSRPRYPEELFAWLAAHSTRREVVWDCATGNGQAAIGLSHWFKHIYATDMSEEQITHAISAPNVTYSQQVAEHSKLPDQSVDLVTVAQALHWFDFTLFWSEVRRVARPGSLFAAWGYDWLFVTPEIDARLIVPFREIIAPFWASNNQILWHGYRDEDIRFPFRRIDGPRISIRMKWTLHQIIAYMKTWSAYKMSRADAATNDAIGRLLAATSNLAPQEQLFDVNMPLKFVLGRLPSESS